MASGWRTRGGGERYTGPIEMRFIDMFMAALGALIFMAMLFAFLIRFMPTTESVVHPPSQSNKALQLLTKALPSAKVGEPYEVAFAYRGGEGAVSWEIKSGAQEAQAGLKFDNQLGVLTGVPTRTGKVRFVLVALDRIGGSDEKPYELAIEPAQIRGGKIEKGLSIATLVVLGLVWLFTAIAVVFHKQQVLQLQEAYDRGETEVTMRTSPFTVEIVQLPGGIETYKASLQWSRYLSRFLLAIVAALGVWLYFSLRGR